MRVYLLLLFVVAIGGCFDAPDKLEYALYLAGDNRPELEKVLEHYKDDSLKLKAAQFLIENMPAYYSYEGWQLDSMKAIVVAARLTQRTVAPEIKKRWEEYPYTSLSRVKDIEVITAGYLIRNIDQAFKVWRTRPWNRSLSFDEFCELLLPYRIENEPLEEWRSLYYERYNPILDSLYKGGDIIEAVSRLFAHTYRKVYRCGWFQASPPRGFLFTRSPDRELSGIV